jgi:hypothetical protein
MTPNTTSNTADITSISSFCMLDRQKVAQYYRPKLTLFNPLNS